MINQGNNNILWSVFTASYLHQFGIHHACISPGARNSPLTYAFTEKSGITCFSHVDERSSAFFALGLAKSSQSPVVLISTSGTAPANFYPAVIEASLSRVPLIILSADRPDFLVNTGANQTINQQNLYGIYVRYFSDVGLPNKELDVLKEILDKAFHYSSGLKLEAPPGPVHLNFPFDKPLMPESVEGINIPSLISTNHPEQEFNVEIPILTKAMRPLIIAGPMEGNTNQEEIIELGEGINAPILADPISQLRFGAENEQILANYDIFLRFKDIQPDLIIRFGRKPTSKVLTKLLEKWRPFTFLVDSWKKLNDDCENFIQSAIGNYCRKQVQNIKWKGSSDWVRELLALETIVENETQKEIIFHEGIIAKTCFESIKEGGHIFVGNSMPIRDVDMFTSTSGKKVTVYSNRGASGIDGVISTALGMCTVSANSHSLLLIGDLSFYHDMNGLLASRYGMNLTIVVINNSGGGIFSFLPIADAGIGQYDQFWTTDTGLNIAKVAELYHCRHFSAENISEIKNCIQESFKKSGVNIIEVKSVISENISSHQDFLNKIEQLFSTS